MKENSGQQYLSLRPCITPSVMNLGLDTPASEVYGSGVLMDSFSSRLVTGYTVDCNKVNY